MNEFFMAAALKEAAKAQIKNEVPIGAVIVHNNRIVARGHNETISKSDPTAHAEMICIRKAAKKFGNYRLTGTTIYSTIEPCPMCAGALIWARITEIVYGAPDIKAGAGGSVCNVTNNPLLNHRCSVTSGILEKDCRSLIQKFFKQKRKKKTRKKP